MEQRKGLSIRKIKREARRKCKSYTYACTKMDEKGMVEACPLKNDSRGCHALLCTEEEIMDAYDKMFKPGIR